MVESELAVGIAMLLFIGAFSLSWRTMESIFFFILGLAAAVGSTLLGLVFMMLGLGLTRNAARRALLQQGHASNVLRRQIFALLLETASDQAK